MTDPRRPHGAAPRTGPVTGGGPGRVADRLRVDLQRAELYRMLDELPRAAAGRQRELVREFELAWARYKATAAGRA